MHPVSDRIKERITLLRKAHLVDVILVSLMDSNASEQLIFSVEDDIRPKLMRL